MVSKYRKAQSAVERQNPKFNRLSPREQEEKIAQYAGLSLVEERTVRKMINLKKESFDEENIDPEFSYKEKPLIDTESVEYEKVRAQFKEALETLEIREETMVRLYYGVLGDSRIKDIKDLNEIFSAKEIHHTSAKAFKNLKRLYEFDLEKNDFSLLSPAEQMFVTLLGKVPESLVEYLHNSDSVENPTDVTYEQIGKIFDVTGPRVRDIVTKALRRMRHPAKLKKIRNTGYLTEEKRHNKRWNYDYTKTVIDDREIT